jgi:dihydroxyacetone kinase-like protein
MKKLINAPEAYVDEAVAGMVAAFPGAYALCPASKRVVVRKSPKASGKVGLVSGGGFGHLPLFAGYVGEGFLDSCAVGNVFAGPAGDDVLAALKAADRGAGVLSVLGNYGGDRMTFEMQTEMLRMGDVAAEIVIVNDDVASAEPAEAGKRRGVAGLLFAFKVAGAAAEAGLPLAEVKRVTQKAIDATRSIGVALGPCYIPTAGMPTFDLPAESIEMGMGIHGEQGVWRGALKPADALTDEMLDRLLADMPLKSGDRVSVLCNSLGATPIEELFILYRHVAARLGGLGVAIVAPKVGHYATSMEMAGASLSFIRLDDELAGHLAAPAGCPFWNNGF